MRAIQRIVPTLGLALGACATITPATLRLEPGASLRQAAFVVDSVRYQGSDAAGQAAAGTIAKTLTAQLARRGHLAGDTTAEAHAVLIRASLAGYATGSAATRLVLGAGFSPAQCVLRVTLVDRVTGSAVGEMVTTQSSGGRLSTLDKCAYSVADALDQAAGARGGR